MSTIAFFLRAYQQFFFLFCIFFLFVFVMQVGADVLRVSMGFTYFFFSVWSFCTNNAQAPSLFSNVTLTSRRSYVQTVSGNSALLQSNGI